MAGMAEEAEEAMPPAREGDCFRGRRDKETSEMNVKNLGTEIQRLRFEREKMFENKSTETHIIALVWKGAVASAKKGA
jgi:hypothetical protein